MTTVFVSNLSEDVWSFIDSISDKKARDYEIEENTYLSERDLFTLASEKIVNIIVPRPISNDFLEYFKSVFDTQEVNVLVPESCSGKISEDSVKDENIINKLIELAGSEKKLTLKAYSTSNFFLDLVDTLRNKGITVETPESPTKKDSWTINYYGSKSGIRKLISDEMFSGFTLPDGVICEDYKDAAKQASEKYIKEGGVVVKTNKGHSGMGVLIFRPGDLPNNKDLIEKKLLETFSKDSYWQKFPIIVESLIAADLKGPGGGFPNAEYLIHPDGKVEFLYFCGMRVSTTGNFCGIEINGELFPSKMAKKIIKEGRRVGEEYSKNGYRGYYEVDLALDKKGMLYLTESNVRRTGGTHVHQTAMALLGRDYMNHHYILSLNNYFIPVKGVFKKFEDLIEKLAPILFDKEKKEGLIIASESLLRQDKLAYIIIGKTKLRATRLEEKMKELLSS